MKKKSLKRNFLLAGFAVVTAVTVAGAGLAFRNFVDPYETVDKIVDGDTIILAGQKQAVRLFGVEAPEVDWCYGLKSLNRLETLLKKRKVQIKEPVVDKFGRIVALVFVDGKLINETMVREGYGAFLSKPGSAQDTMKKAHEYARNNQIGIYSKECVDDSPPDPACDIKGNHDLDRDEWRYLTPECPYYSITKMYKFQGDRWFCSEKEARQAGFVKSSACELGKKR